MFDITITPPGETIRATGYHVEGDSAAEQVMVCTLEDGAERRLPLVDHWIDVEPLTN